MKIVPDPSTANEILWNDPVTDAEHADMIAKDTTIQHDDALHPDGFPSNTRRGTACYFSETALHRFLATNHLTHVIRAHECIPVCICFSFCLFICNTFSLADWLLLSRRWTLRDHIQQFSLRQWHQ